VEKADGYQQLKAKLPPVSRRGLVLIDPPYEIKTDYQAVVTGIHEGYKRFATGTYALWYPVVLRAQIKRMIKELEATGIRKILQIELAVRPDSDQRGMTASGMIVINPPWKLEAADEQRAAVAAQNWCRPASATPPSAGSCRSNRSHRWNLLISVYNRGNQRLRTYGHEQTL
jgi:23S rRNA A2030 N6-methylase RlmJ